MGGKGSGHPRNWEQVRQIIRLREQGLTYAQIGEQVGLSKQRIQKILQSVHAEATRIVCTECSILIGVFSRRGMFTRKGYCLDCLAKHPEAPFGQRIRACRLAAGLTLKELANLIGWPWTTLSAYERGVKMPKWKSVVRMIQVLGAGLVAIGMPGYTRAEERKK